MVFKLVKLYKLFMLCDQNNILYMLTQMENCVGILYDVEVFQCGRGNCFSPARLGKASQPATTTTYNLNVRANNTLSGCWRNPDGEFAHVSALSLNQNLIANFRFQIYSPVYTENSWFASLNKVRNVCALHISIKVQSKFRLFYLCI